MTAKGGLTGPRLETFDRLLTAQSCRHQNMSPVGSPGFTEGFAEDFLGLFGKGAGSPTSSPCLGGPSDIIRNVGLVNDLVLLPERQPLFKVRGLGLEYAWRFRNEWEVTLKLFHPVENRRSECLRSECNARSNKFGDNGQSLVGEEHGSVHRRNFLAPRRSGLPE